MSEEKKDQSCKNRIEKIRVWFDCIVILAMIVGLYAAFRGNQAAFESNKTAREALRKTYIPWLRIDDLQIKPIVDNKLTIDFSVRNYSQAPAFSVIPDILKPKSPVSRYKFSKTAIMPNDRQSFSSTYEGQDAQSRLKAIKDGKMPLRIVVEFYDVFHKKKRTMEEEFLWDKEKGGLAPTDYTVSGYD